MSNQLTFMCFYQLINFLTKHGSNKVQN